MRRVGCHVSIAGGIVNAPQRAADLGCEVFQMFTRSPQGGPAPVIDEKVASEFKSEMGKWGQQDCYIHTPYYINFASSNSFVRSSAVRVCREELERGSLIGAKYIMTHLGSAKDFSREEALEITAEGVKEVIKGYTGSTKFLIEISAGAGNIMGDTFEELAVVTKGLGDKVGFCIDSAHMFASGYNLKTEEGFKETISIIEKTVGLDAICLIHSNDSQIELGGRKDRHDHIGFGKIGKDGFVYLMHQFNLDFILETEHDKVKEDIATLKQIREQI